MHSSQKTTGHGTIQPIHAPFGGGRVGTTVIGDNNLPVTDFTDAEWDYLHTLPAGTFVRFDHTITADETDGEDHPHSPRDADGNTHPDAYWEASDG